MSKIVPKCPNVFWGFFREENFFPLIHGGSSLGNFFKKNFKIPWRPQIVPKSVQTCFEQALGRFFRIFFCRVFNPGLFRFSGLKILGSDSRTWKQKFSFPDLKLWVQFYDTKINRHSFCIHATVNIRNSISDVLDLKLWVQIPEFKSMSSVSRTWKMWVQFSGPKFWGRELEKIKRKNQKSFKVPKMSKNASKCPNVFWGDFFEHVFFLSVPWSHRKFSKKSKKFQNCRNAQNRCQNCPNLFWTCFVAIFSKKNFAPCSMEGRVFESFQNIQKNFKIPKLTKVVFKGVQTCFEHALRRFFRISLPSVPCRAFQIFWT